MIPRTATATALVGILSLLLAACTPAPTPTYASVRTDAEQAVADVVAALPDGTRFTRSGDVTSTPCESDAGAPTGPDGAAFATVQGAAVLPDAQDAAAVVTDLPLALGEDWAVEPAGIDTAVATVRLNRAGTGVSVDVTEQAGDGSATLDILAVSPCGQVD
ncbi:hypothetical protein ACIQLK_14080 [Microbacterium sp. NPDC091382]|uniref:hypothetical protein n=1 Tax=Microbacterium sp. NPDC091382 TaxID=3364210 RepID=UPI00382F0705